MGMIVGGKDSFNEENFRIMIYKNYKIEPNNTGYVNFDFYSADDCDAPITGHGKTIEDCKEQIDEIENEN